MSYSFVHYEGWGTKYDNWVEESQIREMGDLKIDKLGSVLPDVDEEARHTRGGVKIERPEDNESNKRSIKLDGESEESVKKRIRRFLDMNLLDEPEEVPLKLQLPFALKKHLYDEWNMISHRPRRVISLPRPYTVSMIVQEFLEIKAEKLQGESLEEYSNFMKDFQSGFQKALPTVLLYRQEHKQLDRIEASYPGLSFCDMYGFEHLLRFFVRAPKLLRNVSLPKGDIALVENKFAEVIKHLHKNMEKYSSPGDYVLDHDNQGAAAGGGAEEDHEQSEVGEEEAVVKEEVVK